MKALALCSAEKRFFLLKPNNKMRPPQDMSSGGRFRSKILGIDMEI